MSRRFGTDLTRISLDYEAAGALVVGVAAGVLVVAFEASFLGSSLPPQPASESAPRTRAAAQNIRAIIFIFLLPFLCGLFGRCLWILSHILFVLARGFFKKITFFDAAPLALHITPSAIHPSKGFNSAANAA